MRKDEGELTPEEETERLEQKADELREDGIIVKFGHHMKNWVCQKCGAIEEDLYFKDGCLTG